MSPDPSVRRWLHCLWATILCMVVVGGTTRLTGSGLSMVDWHPLMGAVPPLSEQDWLDVFARYRRSPQFEQVNHWMQLSDFKRIFFWEYLHRLLGRVVGLVFFVPFLFFWVRGRLRGGAVWRALLALFLGGAQGLLGWYMVKSGLVDRPEVSHYRLAAHLSLAFIVGQWVWWLALETTQEPPMTAPPVALRVGAWGFVGLLGVQIVWGAFMAGKRAGFLSATFPDMNGHYGPAAFFGGSSLLGDLLDNPLAIHWTHRALGFVVAIAAVALWWSARQHGDAVLRRRATGVVHLVALQFALGVATVMLHVPTVVAVAHQGCAFILLTATVRLCHHLRSCPEAAAGSRLGSDDLGHEALAE